MRTQNWPEEHEGVNPNKGPEVCDRLLEHKDLIYLPWVEVMIGNQKCCLLIDTGADVNVLDEKVARKLKMTRTKILNPLLVRFVQGSANVTKKLMSVPVRIGGAIRKHEFLIMNLGAGMDGILLWNWLQEAKAKLNVAQGVLTVIDELRAEHDKTLIVKERPEQPNHAAYRFQQAKVAFQIYQEGLHPNKPKIRAFVEWPTPRNAKELRSFMRLAAYFKRFVFRFAHKAAILYRLLRKMHVFVWKPTTKRAFQRLRKALTEAPMLVLPKLGEPFDVHTDASSEAIGGILMQNGHLVAYESHKLNNTEAQWLAHEHEMYVVVYCLKKWDGGDRLRGEYYFQTKPKLSRKQQSWQVELAKFDIEW
ncbi:hypothetical protein R1sor_020977 [Riccia sorocarpa]|uniref:Reverse transcriptase/retrotransposon-derived protein RNase H-like domain-containing protein n=1 Tax=Riccia sorocarpa TaxID=122646 RepID=A0ABD3GH73_9MARC